MQGMGWRPVARLVRSALAPALLCLSTFAWLACDFGLDVDALTRGCPGCADASGTEGDAREIDDASAVDGGAELDASACPAGRGPEMVRVADLCIDRTEVTNEQYAEFLASGFRPEPSADGLCDPAASFVPSEGWPPPPAEPKHPVRYVRWCAARAFCEWAGKRLCGNRKGDEGAGGPLTVSLFGRHDFDEWFAACSSDGALAYPYGNDYVASACNGRDYRPLQAPIPAGSLDSCAAPGGGARDLSGNVWEWIDACDELGCYARGGGFNSPPAELACISKLHVTGDAGTTGVNRVGIRCCAR